MSTVKTEMRKNTIIQCVVGVVLFFILNKKESKKAVVNAGAYEPIGVEYISTYFKDSEYFGVNVIPVDYYGNWLGLAKALDKIRVGFGSAILIKKGFTIVDEKYNTCKAVEIYPQNNNVARLKEVIEFMKPELILSVIEYKDNKNIYLEI